MLPTKSWTERESVRLGQGAKPARVELTWPVLYCFSTWLSSVLTSPRVYAATSKLLDPQCQNCSSLLCYIIWLCSQLVSSHYLPGDWQSYRSRTGTHSKSQPKNVNPILTSFGGTARSDGESGTGSIGQQAYIASAIDLSGRYNHQNSHLSVLGGSISSLIAFLQHMKAFTRLGDLGVGYL